MPNSTTSDHWESATVKFLWGKKDVGIALLALICISLYLLLRLGAERPTDGAERVLWGAMLIGGIPLLIELLLGVVRGQFGSDLLAGMSIATAAVLNEPLAGTLVVLMLSGGAALETFAVKKASSVLEALAQRMPSVAHQQVDNSLIDIAIDKIAIGDLLVVLPHECCPVDGVVVQGHGSMDEAYLTGEPFQISKSIGSAVLSGALNGNSALTIQAVRLAQDSRYARIMQVMQQSQQQRPQLRRLGDQLGMAYTPLAVAVATAAWIYSGEALRFLAVLVIATPCPLLIAIPVAIIGSISLSAKRGIIIRDPIVLERIGTCNTMIFDKTGTLTYGKPSLVEQIVASQWSGQDVLSLVASVEQYSKHPLATAVIQRARSDGAILIGAQSVQESPGQGMSGKVGDRQVRVTSTKQLLAQQPDLLPLLPPASSGLECVVVIDQAYAATYRFRDEPREESASFIGHLSPKHGFEKLLLVSGDRHSEVAYLASQVGITQVYAGKSPEEKLQIVREYTARGGTVYVGDGINDAPAMLAATVGLAMGQNSEVTAQAAGAVIMNNRLGMVDELLHIATRMRRIALQSAVGGMVLSLIGMFFAALGYLPPVAGALCQELIDVLAVLNALRAAWPPLLLSDYPEST
jgi:heavy metal translocating P-type ATPase